MPEKDLVRLYLSLVLPVLDYTCVVYHSMLSITQENGLESLQKLALKIVYGVTGVSYDELLRRSGLCTLKERRMKLLDKFILKAVNHPTYGAWFPTKHFVHYNMRREKIYEETFARTKRLYNSPIFYMRRRLNHISQS